MRAEDKSEDKGINVMTSAFISAGAAIIVCLLNNYFMERRRASQQSTDIEVLKATIRSELNTLTKAVEKHNQVVERVYDAEARLDLLEERQKVANHRIDDLERI